MWAKGLELIVYVAHGLGLRALGLGPLSIWGPCGYVLDTWHATGIPA